MKFIKKNDLRLAMIAFLAFGWAYMVYLVYSICKILSF